MAKYTITVTEYIPSATSALQRAIRQLPPGHDHAILKLETDKDIVAEIASLVAGSKPSSKGTE